MQNYLLTQDRLMSWFGVAVDLRCSLCEADNESCSHLFFTCAYSRLVLLNVTEWLGVANIPCGNSAWRAWLLQCSKRRTLKHSVWIAGIAAVVHWVWTERNCRKHGQEKRDVSLLPTLIRAELQLRLVALQGRAKKPTG